MASSDPETPTTPAAAGVVPPARIGGSKRKSRSVRGKATASGPRGSPGRIAGAQAIAAYLARQKYQSKLTMGRLKAIAEGIEQGLPRGVICDIVGIGRDTLRAWEANHPPISDMLARAESRFAARAIGLINNAVAEGDWRAGAWWLERRRPTEWAKSHTLDGQGGFNWAEMVAALAEDPE